MNRSISPAHRGSIRTLVSVLAALLAALVIGLAGPALAAGAGGPDTGHGNGNGNGPQNSQSDHADPASTSTPTTTGDAGTITDIRSTADTAATQVVHPAGANGNGNANGSGNGNVHQSAQTTHGPDHSQGNAGTSGDVHGPQPLSNADNNSAGANGQCAGGAYCSTRDGTASKNGNGNGNAKGKPCAGCVGKADNKNPQGQRPGGSDHNAGYECDGNHGIGRTNPAHTGCATPNTPPPPPQGCPPGQVKTGGVCVVPPLTCPAGTTPDHGQCVVTEPPTSCPPGTSNQHGTCVAPPTTCPPGSTARNNQCVVTEPPTSCPDGTSAQNGQCVVTSAPPGNGGGTAPQTGSTAPQGAAPATDTVGPGASTGSLPNTGAPAHALLLLLGGLALLGCGAWAVRRQVG